MVQILTWGGGGSLADPPGMGRGLDQSFGYGFGGLQEEGGREKKGGHRTWSPSQRISADGYRDLRSEGGVQRKSSSRNGRGGAIGPETCMGDLQQTREEEGYIQGQKNDISGGTTSKK